MPINNLNLRDTYGAGYADEQTSQYNALRIQGAKNDERRADEAARAEAQRANTEWLANAADQVLQNPAVYDALLGEGKKRGIIAPDFNAPFDANAITQLRDTARVALGSPQQKVESSTAAQKNYAARQKLVSEGASQEELARFDNYVRAQQLAKVGGVQSVVGPGGSVDPLSTLDQEADAAAKIKEAEALASGRAGNVVKTEADAPKKAAREKTKAESAQNVRSTISRAKSNANAWTTGLVGSKVASIPGTPAYNLAQDLLTIKANIGFDRLQQMREESKTGGALGQVAVQELNALQATIASLDQAQSREQLIANLDAVDQQYAKAVQAVEAAQSERIPEGIDPADWQYMTPEQRALWQK